MFQQIMEISKMKKLRLFFSLDWEFKKLLLEAFFYLGWGRLLKLLPFSRIAPSLGQQKVETTYSLDSSFRVLLAHISQAIHLMSRYTVWESECMVKAIAAMKMLERRQIESTIYFGTAKDMKGKLIAHAWLRSGPYYITGADGIEGFIVVNTFAKKMTPKR